jgi:hypothetical protein
VTKFHRTVQFKQTEVFKDYIDLNTRKRAASTNAFDKDFYKLKNNSLYGKTVENLKNRMNLRLCNSEARLVTYASSALFRRSMKIADDLVAVLLNKEEVTLDRPSYIGQAVLDLSKLRMYQLQYQDLELYRNKFNCQIDIVAGDTDSFFIKCHGVKTQLLLTTMQKDGLLDTSNYPKDHPLFSTVVANKIGLFKDESCGNRFKEMIFLRPKCYSLLYENNKEVLKAKGVNIKNSELRHDSYRKVYEEGGSISVAQTRILSKNHQLFTEKSTKKALQCLDDKRVWIGRNWSLAYGHHKLSDF